MILQGRLTGVVSSIFLIIGLLVNTAYAKNNDEITYLPNWAVGDSASYTLVQKSTKCKYSVTSHVQGISGDQLRIQVIGDGGKPGGHIANTVNDALGALR